MAKIQTGESQVKVLGITAAKYMLVTLPVVNFRVPAHFTNDLHEHYISRSTCCLVKHSARRLGMIHLHKNSLMLRLLPLGNTVHTNKTGRKLAGGDQHNFIFAGNNHYH